MKELIAYAMGLAAKSNVEKRQVGCAIVAHWPDKRFSIVGEGFNTEEYHAEYIAVEDMMAKAQWPKDAELVAYVTHQPCPECAKLLLSHHITRVEVVEAFMKFDSDKLRYDLIDSDFARKLLNHVRDEDYKIAHYRPLKNLLYDCGKGLPVEVGAVSPLMLALHTLTLRYKDTQAMEDALARVLTFGASKYKPNNWRKCKDTGRYLAACHRHNNAALKGEKCDSESGFDHDDHILTNIMFLDVLGLENPNG